MADTVLKIDKFHQTKKGKLAFGVLEILLSYVVVARAINTGSLWEWLVGLLFLIGGANNLVRMISIKGKKKDVKNKPDAR